MDGLQFMTLCSQGTTALYKQSLVVQCSLVYNDFSHQTQLGQRSRTTKKSFSVTAATVLYKYKSGTHFDLSAGLLLCKL